MKWRSDIQIRPGDELHVWPEEEEREHVLKGRSCECVPKVIREGKTQIIVHHSYKISARRRRAAK